MATLQTLTDFATLRSLALHQHQDRSALEKLTAGSELRSLEELTLMLSEGNESAAQSFILSVPPLKHLQLYGACSTAFLYGIMDHCGQRLRRLHCMSVFLDEPMLERLLQSCPCVEDLRFNIYRFLESEEVTLLHSFGKLPALRRLELGTHIRQDISSEIRSPGSKLTIAAFDNAVLLMKHIALDQELARSMYRAIASAKVSGAQPLESLTLSLEALRDEQGAASEDFVCLLWHIGRSWVCSRKTCGKDMQQCDAQPFESKEDVEHRQELEEDGLFEDLLRGPFREAILTVWPQCEHNAFQNVWHSFPLVEASGIA